MLDDTGNVHPWIQSAHHIARRYVVDCDAHAVRWDELSLADTRQHKRQLCYIFHQFQRFQRRRHPPPSKEFTCALKARCAVVNKLIKQETSRGSLLKLHREMWIEMLENCSSSSLRTIVNEHTTTLPWLKDVLQHVISHREWIEVGIDHADHSLIACMEVFAHNQRCALFMLRAITHSGAA